MSLGPDQIRIQPFFYDLLHIGIMPDPVLTMPRHHSLAELAIDTLTKGQPQVERGEIKQGFAWEFRRTPDWAEEIESSTHVMPTGDYHFSIVSVGILDKVGDSRLFVDYVGQSDYGPHIDIVTDNSKENRRYYYDLNSAERSLIGYRLATLALEVITKARSE